MHIRLAIIILVLSFLSCSKIDKGNLILNEQKSDSALYHYNLARDKTNSINKRHENINKAFKLVKKGKNDTLVLKILFRKNSIHSRLKQFDSLRYFNEVLFNLANSNNNDQYLGQHYYLKGYYFNIIKKIPDSAFYYYNQSKSYFTKINDSSQVGRRLLTMALIQQNSGDYFGSKETITESLQYLLPYKDIKYIASAYSVLATNHRKLFNFDDSKKYYIKAIQTASAREDKLKFTNNLATAYTSNKEYSKAIKKLIEINNDTLYISKPIQKARVIDNLAYARWLKNKNDIEFELQTALKIRLNNNDKRGQIASYTHLCEYFLEKNQEKAKLWIKKALGASKEIKNPKGELDALKLFMRIEPNNVNLKNRFIKLRDSIYKLELQVKTQFAKIKYDDKLKQEKILKLDNENAEKESEILKQRNQKTFYFFGIIVLLIVIGFLAYFFKQRNKRSKQETKIKLVEKAYEVETQISKTIHDDLGNNVFQVMMQFKNNPSDPIIPKKLNEIYNKTRDISREYSGFDVEGEYNKQLYSMLTSFTSDQTKLVLRNFDNVNWQKMSKAVKITLYQVLQELMINMKKHSEAKFVGITFIQQSNKLSIRYSDNGIGASKKRMLHKNGLQNTEKRIRAINGTIIFDSENENGFKAKIQIPS